MNKIARLLVCCVLLAASAAGGAMIGRAIFLKFIRQPMPEVKVLRVTITHGATLRLTLDNGVCSGTAIGPHKVLTATHCLDGSVVVAINNRPASVLSRLDDGKDHSVITVDIEFEVWAKVGQTPKQGDHIRWWGNPIGLPDQYREGVVSGFDSGRVLIDGNIGHGDSGAGVFNDQGELVGVISAVGQSGIFHLGMMNALGFRGPL